MLQQTQVSRVMERYGDFLRRFPTVAALASANEQDVLELWQGMGYYRRARHLHEAARLVMRDYRGRVPRTADQLRTLPGVGRYTAGAIASIVFGERTPIVDGNVERVLARLFARTEPPGKDHAWTWRTAEELVNVAEAPGVFNEAMMELGATICTPRSPNCGACPLAAMCEAKRRGMQHEIPPAEARSNRREAHHHAVVVTRGKRRTVLVEQRPEGGMWAGMWQVPTIEGDQKLEADHIAPALPITVQSVTPRGSFEHHTTHRAITFHVFAATSRSRKGTWLDAESDAIRRLPMSAAQRRVLALAMD